MLVTKVLLPPQTALTTAAGTWATHVAVPENWLAHAPKNLSLSREAGVRAWGTAFALSVASFLNL